MKQRNINLNLITFAKFFIILFVIFFFYPQRQYRHSDVYKNYNFTRFSGKPGKKGAQNTIYIKDEHKHHVDAGEWMETATPNCIFQTQIKEYQYVIGRNPMPEMAEYIFYWGESEANTIIRDPYPFDCERWCAHGIKFWYNKYSTGIVADIPRYDQGIQNASVKKEKDLLISLSNCETRRLHYLKTWIKKIQNEMPHVTITLCGRCFGDKIDPECPPRSKIWTAEHLLWIKKHKFAVAMENSVCNNYVTEKLINPIFTQTIPILFTHSYLPWWISDFSHRFLTMENFFTEHRKLTNEKEYKKMLFEPKEIDSIIQHIPTNFNQICQWVTECEKDRELCHKKLKEKTEKNFAQCLQDCKNEFGCHLNFDVPKEWKEYEIPLTKKEKLLTKW